ncbi:MAG: GNAT family N-acetyltransferase [Alistipes sp.]|nr:GNAT family N-acetyltransferase [Alistipes sp.]
MDKIYKHPRLGDVVLRQRWTTSRISLSVKPTGEVRLSYPRLVSTAKALRFLEEKAEWVLQMREKISQRAMQGSDYSSAQIEELRREAKQVLPAMVARLARQYGFSYGRVTIRATRSKWGCCTSRNNLSLSLFLMTLPAHLQEFVVLHELCHTVHHNHSAEFHTLLDKVTGGREKELNRQLKGIRKNLRFRKGSAEDLGAVMGLVADAQKWFAGQNIDQWQDGYPTQDIILSDISYNNNYIVELNGVISATFVASFDGEPTYFEIKGKGWLNENPYAVVHRIAVADKCRRKGIAKEILHYAEELCVERGVKDIRIDTHRDNVAMRSLLKKMGYAHCGRITLTSGAFREAYHKIIN